jgi:beta-glucanase (GH16 family)
MTRRIAGVMGCLVLTAGLAAGEIHLGADAALAPSHLAAPASARAAHTKFPVLASIALRAPTAGSGEGAARITAPALGGRSGRSYARVLLAAGSWRHDDVWADSGRQRGWHGRWPHRPSQAGSPPPQVATAEAPAVAPGSSTVTVGATATSGPQAPSITTPAPAVLAAATADAGPTGASGASAAVVVRAATADAGPTGASGASAAVVVRAATADAGPTGASGASAAVVARAAVGTTGASGPSDAAGAQLTTQAGSTGSTGSTGEPPTTVAHAVAAPTPPAVAPSPPAAPGPPSEPIGDPGTWHSIFDDEFNGSALDTTKWSTGWLGSGITGPINPFDELSCYDPANVTESGGELDIAITATQELCSSGDGAIDEPYTTGLVSTNGHFDYSFGFFEARVWLPATATGTIADWPAIWAEGQTWPQDGEDDLVEGLGGQACWHFHYGTSTSDVNGLGGCAPASYAGGWHTFGSDWEPGSVTYYYDGKVVGQITTGITSAPMFLILDLAVDHTYGGPIATPAAMRVDYVRVWQH